MSISSLICIVFSLIGVSNSFAAHQQNADNKKKDTLLIIEGETNPLIRVITPYSLSKNINRNKDVQKNKSLLKKINKNEPLKVKQILNKPGKKSGNTFLHRAIIRGDYDLAELEIQNGADPLQANSRGISALGLILKFRSEAKIAPPVSHTLMRTLLNTIKNQEEKSKVPFPLSVLDAQEVDSLIGPADEDEQRQRKIQEIENFVKRYVGDEHKHEEKIYESKYHEDINITLLREGINDFILQEIRGAIQKSIPKNHVEQLSSMIHEIVRYIKTPADADLLQEFVRKSPFLKTQAKLNLKIKIQIILDLNKLPELLRQLIIEDHNDQNLIETYIYLADFTHEFIHTRLSCVKDASEKECSICGCDFKNMEIKLQCGHSYHPECIKPGVEVYLEQENVKLLKSCAHPKCEHEITPSELASMISEASQVLRIQKLFTRAIPNSKFCPNCGHGLAFWTEQHGFDQQCQRCEKELCFNCGGHPHVGITCEEILTEAGIKKHILLELVKSGQDRNFGLCPKCYAIIEKMDGCNDMYCGENAKDKGHLPKDKKGSSAGRGCGAEFNWNGRILIVDALNLKEAPKVSKGLEIKPYWNFKYSSTDTSSEDYTNTSSENDTDGSSEDYTNTSSDDSTDSSSHNSMSSRESSSESSY